MRSVMSHQFSQVPSAEIPRSSFDRSHGYKTTFDAGELIPVFVDEALPGDTFNLKMHAFGRLATPIFPFMDNLFLDSFFFAVPIRLIWDNFQKFNGEQRNPGDSTDFLIPQVVTIAGGFTVGSLFDYFGVPVLKHPLSISALWSRAYNLIWNEWFRDENLQNSLVVDVDDGPDVASDYIVKRRGKRHDYFTSALPWPQKGPAVPLPLTGNAPVKGIGFNGTTSASLTGATFRESSALPNRVYPFAVATNAASQAFIEHDNGGASAKPMVYADLSAVTAATINTLRQSFQIQKLYERDARGGTRYTEIVRSHFGVVSPDARLQRPEYLGGGTTPIQVNPVAQTSETTTGAGGSSLGVLGAMGTVSVRGHGFSKSFTEHCVLIGMVCVRADLTYQQGLNRMWSRRTRWDFYWPALAHIGEQAVFNKEIFFQALAADELVFGYQERYAEYRYKPSQITGLFRSDVPTSLDVWHLSQDFSALPALNAAFIEDTPPLDRVIAVPSEPHFLFDSYFQLRCARPMPVYSVPGLIDHF